MDCDLRKLLRAALLVAPLCGTLSGLGWAQEPPAPAASPSDRPPTLPETRVEGALPSEFEPAESNDPVVTGSMFASPLTRGYRADSSTTGSLIDIPDLELPGTVNVIPEDVLRDQQVLELQQAIRNAGGISFGGANIEVHDRFLLRGLELGTRDFRRDGFFDPTLVPRDFQDIERVEVLKGPASTLYGAGSPAGVVNLITKRPMEAEFANFGFMVGSFNDIRYTGDINGYVNDSGSLLYRINFAQEDAESFRDYGFLSRTSISPSLTWNIDCCTRLTYQVQWHRDNRRGDGGLPALFGDPLALPSSRFIGDPATDFFRTEETRQSLVLTRELNDCWTFTLGGYSLFDHYPNTVTFASGNPDPNFFPSLPEPFFYRQRASFTNADEQSQSVVANLAGEFDTGGFEHKAVIGTEYIYFHSNTSLQFDVVNPINVLSPPFFPSFALGGASAEFPLYQQQRVGAYAEDQIQLTEQLSLLAGVRLDTINFRFDRSLNFPPLVATFNTDENFTYTTPRAGFVFEPWCDESLAFYVNYSQSFAPPAGGIYTNTTDLKPVTGEGFEAGVKTELLENLSLNACGFYITRQNADLLNRSIFLTQVAEERSRGAEVNLVGNLTEQWSAIANYTYADVRLFDPFDPLLDGNYQRNVPFNSANLWTRYNVVQDECRTLGAAIGLVYQDRRPANLSNTLYLPSYTRWDAGLFYTRGPIDVSFYAENIFNVQYATGSIDEFQIFPGAPANVRATVVYSF